VKNKTIKNVLNREQRNIELFEGHAKECMSEIHEKGFDVFLPHLTAVMLPMIIFKRIKIKN